MSIYGVKTKSTTELRELKTQEQRRATSGGNGCNEDLQACFSSVILRSLSSQPLTPPTHPRKGSLQDTLSFQREPLRPCRILVSDLQHCGNQLL